MKVRYSYNKTALG